MHPRRGHGCLRYTTKQSRAENEKVEALVRILGVDADKLNALINTNTTEATLNEYGRFDNLKGTIDKQKATAYFEGAAGETLSPAKVNMKAATLLRIFILDKKFKLERFKNRR